MAVTPFEQISDRMSQIEAVCFDAFGTLVEITDKRRAFRALLSEGPKDRRATDALISPLGLRDIARELEVEIGEARLLELEHDLAANGGRSGSALAWS